MANNDNWNTYAYCPFVPSTSLPPCLTPQGVPNSQAISRSCWNHAKFTRRLRKRNSWGVAQRRTAHLGENCKSRKPSTVLKTPDPRRCSSHKIKPNGCYRSYYSGATISAQTQWHRTIHMSDLPVSEGRCGRASVLGVPTAALQVSAGAESQLSYDWGRGLLWAHMADGSRQDLGPPCLLPASPSEGLPKRPSASQKPARESASNSGIRSIHSMVTQVAPHTSSVSVHKIQTQGAGKRPSCPNKDLSRGTKM